jgi:hypothetical protein
VAGLKAASYLNSKQVLHAVIAVSNIGTLGFLPRLSDGQRTADYRHPATSIFDILWFIEAVVQWKSILEKPSRFNCGHVFE